MGVVLVLEMKRYMQTTENFAMLLIVIFICEICKLPINVITSQKNVALLTSTFVYFTFIAFLGTSLPPPPFIHFLFPPSHLPLPLHPLSDSPPPLPPLHPLPSTSSTSSSSSASSSNSLLPPLLFLSFSSWSFYFWSSSFLEIFHSYLLELSLPRQIKFEYKINRGRPRRSKDKLFQRRGRGKKNQFTASN